MNLIHLFHWRYQEELKIQEELRRKEEEKKRKLIEKLKKHYLYFQHPSDWYRKSGEPIILSKIYQNDFHEPFEAFFPYEEKRVLMVYPRRSLSLSEIRKIVNDSFYEQLCNGKVLNLSLLLQLFIPLLPHVFKYDPRTEAYNVCALKHSFDQKMNEKACTSQNVERFLKRVQKKSSFTIFGGAALHYFTQKYVTDHCDNNNELPNSFLQSPDYDLNITYPLEEEMEPLQFTNYIVYMICEINHYYYKSIVCDPSILDICNQEKPYINIFVTFSDKDEMNRYLWLLGKTKYVLHEYCMNTYTEEAMIYKATFIHRALHTMLVLKYVKKSIEDVKAIVKIEVHQNQLLSVEERTHRDYAPFDFIFREEIENEYIYHDAVKSLDYNDPIFLTLVYVDLLQKYKRKCESVFRRMKKAEKDNERYYFLIKSILIPYMMEKKKSEVAKTLFHWIYDYGYEEKLAKALLSFPSSSNIYTQMNEFHEFMIQEADRLCMEEILPMYRIDQERNTPLERCMSKSKSKRNHLLKESEISEEMIPECVCEKMILFLREIHYIRDTKYKMIEVHDEKLKSTIQRLKEKSESIKRVKGTLQWLKSEYQSIYIKMKETMYKNEWLNQKIFLVKSKIEMIQYYIDDIEAKENDYLFQESLKKIYTKKYEKICREKRCEEEKRREEAKRHQEEEEQKRRDEDLKRREEEKKIKAKEKEKLKEEEERRREYEKRVEAFQKKIALIRSSSKKMVEPLIWMYNHISFMTLLKIFGLFGMLGIILYGKYLHYQEEVEKELRWKSHIQYQKKSMRTFGKNQKSCY